MVIRCRQVWLLRPQPTICFSTISIRRLSPRKVSTIASKPWCSGAGTRWSAGSATIATSSSTCCGPSATTMPNSAISPRNELINMVRCLTGISRTPVQASSGQGQALVDAGRRLLHLGLDRDEAHRWAAHRLADRLGVRRIVLVAPDIGLGVGRWDQPRVMAELGDLARPVVRRRTRLHPNQARRQLGKERQNL